MQSSSKVTGYIVYIPIHANIESPGRHRNNHHLTRSVSFSHSRTLMYTHVYAYVCTLCMYVYIRTHIHTYVSLFIFSRRSICFLILSCVIGTENVRLLPRGP
jgi:hypothetical protein